MDRLEGLALSSGREIERVRTHDPSVEPSVPDAGTGPGGLRNIDFDFCIGPAQDSTRRMAISAECAALATRVIAIEANLINHFISKAF